MYGIKRKAIKLIIFTSIYNNFVLETNDRTQKSF